MTVGVHPKANDLPAQETGELFVAHRVAVPSIVGAAAKSVCGHLAAVGNGIIHLEEISKRHFVVLLYLGELVFPSVL